MTKALVITLLLFFFLLIIACVALVRLYRLKASVNKIISDKSTELEILVSKQVKLLEEKEWLLKEVHHRVKNNLHTIISLLDIQAEFLKGDALAAIQDSQARIFAISLIHQKLYASDDVKTVKIHDYIHDLIQYLKQTVTNEQKIVFEISDTSLEMDIPRATPLGLIVNEAVTNAIKHAFPDRRKGFISIAIFKTGKYTVLQIADSGVGFTNDLETQKQHSLGLKLIEGLTRELGGKLEISSKNGVVLRVTFSIFNSADHFTT